MPNFKLFVAPGSCARVPTIALEEIGVPFETGLIRLGAGDQFKPEFLAVNPKGKVPALLIDGVPLTENVAILTWLNKTFPDANLLPNTTSDLEAVKQIADLSAFSGTFHPIVTRIAMPAKMVSDKAATNDVRQTAIKAMHSLMSMINDRLSDRPWWYGDTWSIVDAYLFWIWWRIDVVDYPNEEFTNIADHAARIIKRPSVARAMESEAINAEIVRSQGYFVPNPKSDL